MMSLASSGLRLFRPRPLHGRLFSGGDDKGPKDLVPSARPPPLNRLGKTNPSEVESHPAKNFDVTAGYSNQQGLHKELYFKPLESSYQTTRPLDPFPRTWDIITNQKKSKFYKEDFKAFYDIVIIGGGIMGCATAYFLSQKIYKQMHIAVIERDPTYEYCSTCRSVGGLRQQFSIPENVELSLYGADFLRNANKLLYVDGLDPPDVKFKPHGYLFLASEEGAEIMQENHKTQLQCGAKVELMTPKRLKRRFPWLNTEGVALGSYGYENEGWFDPWALLSALRLKATELGVDFIRGDVYNIAHAVNEDKIYKDDEEIEDEMKRLSNRPCEAHVHLPNGEVYPIHSSIFVIAAGAQSGHVANMAGIGCGPGMLRVPLPVEPRKRFVYNVHAPRGPGLATPLVVDPSGFYFRREGHGNDFLCGMSPQPDREPSSVDNHDVDYDFFDEQIWPRMANRVKAFEELKVKSAWAGFYDYNSWDQNAIVGNHPFHNNVFFATGFSGHGIQQAPGIGRALMELILEDGYTNIDLSRLHFDRILNDEFMRERNIV